MAETAALLGERADEFALIDCREEDEHAFCKIGGSRLFPLSTAGEWLPSLIALGGEMPLVIYCHHGMRSAQLAHHLRQRGVARAFSMAGGIDAWTAEIDPSVPRY
ncbi:MAG: rhodanese-like domain-containing protein [Verrucomicrobiales bacterium]